MDLLAALGARLAQRALGSGHLREPVLVALPPSSHLGGRLEANPFDVVARSDPVAAVPLPCRVPDENGVEELRPGRLAEGWAAPCCSSVFKLMSRPGPAGRRLHLLVLAENCSICSRE